MKDPLSPGLATFKASDSSNVLFLGVGEHFDYSSSVCLYLLASDFSISEACLNAVLWVFDPFWCPVGQSCFLFSEEVLNLPYVPSLSSDSCFISVSVLSLDFFCEVGTLQAFWAWVKGTPVLQAALCDTTYSVVCLIINILFYLMECCVWEPDWMIQLQICFLPKFQLFWKFIICLECQSNIFTISVIMGKK